ncbi:Cna protein B-type domain protein [mine drainage metagenome]|uniref:Cna protein B-type domain protein n=1 Tax=mine drainage metagenome TaxID=410659 RepID=A0A1J5SNB5_9ZZZZ
MKVRGIDLRSSSWARISAAIRNACVISLLLGATGCGGGGSSGAVTSSPPISINDPVNGFTTTETSINVTGFVSRPDGSLPTGTVYWTNGSSSGSSPVTCGALCCLIVCVGSWQATVPLTVGSNTISATFESASTSVTGTRILAFAVSGKAYMQGTIAALTSPDVMVSRTDPASSTLYGAYLDASGNYTFTGLLAGSYTINPYLPLPGSPTCLTFTPASRTVSVSTTDITGQDFAATTASPCYSIQGQVTYNSVGVGVSGISVYIQNAAGQSTYRTTDLSGVYQFNYLAPGSYTIAPLSCTFAGCITFSPASLTVFIVNTSVTGQNFVVLY